MIKKASLLVALCLAVIHFSPGPACAEADPSAALQQIQGRLTEVFGKMDRELSAVTAKLATIDFGSPEARDIMRRCSSHPYSVDCVIFDAKGVMKVIEPAPYTKYEGTDLGSDKILVTIKETKKPIFSSMFRAAEGMDAVSAQYPILAPGEDLLGSLSVLIRPEVFLAKVIEPIVQTTPFACMVMQTDGLILYDADPGEIGKNLYTNPQYKDFPEVLAAGRKMAKEETGSATYHFLKHDGQGSTRKEIVWATTGLYGTEWRIGVISELAEQAVR